MKPLHALRILLVVILLPLFFSIPAPASAQGEWEIVVNDIRDLPDMSPDNVCDAVSAESGQQCTLRAAIFEANKHATSTDQGVLITIPAGDYTLALEGADENDGATGDLDIRPEHMNIIIQGASAATTIIDAAGLDRVFQVHASSFSVEIRDVTITGGSLLGSGTATYQYCGAGVFNSGTLTLSNVIIHNNHADQTDSSPLIYAYGGGILNANPGNLTVDSSIIRDNTAVRGGGISNYSTLTILNSTISGNQAISSQTSNAQAGAIYNMSSASIANSTISGNSATDRAGGIYNQVYLKLANVTLVRNSSPNNPANLYNFADYVFLRNSIIAYPGGASGAANCLFLLHIASSGYNVSDDTSCDFASTGDRQNVDPLLGPLANNGGFAPTHGLLFGSPANDHNPGPCLFFDDTPVTTDQRGASRSDGSCDTGAFEGLTWPVFLPAVRR